MASNVFFHDDGIIDHEAGRNRQRHQRQIVQAVAQQMHHAEGADQRDRHREAGDHGRAAVVQEQQDRHHHQHYGQQQLGADMVDGRAYAGGAVAQHIDLDGGRHRGLQLGQLALDRIDGVDHIGARLSLHVQDHGRRQVGPGTEAHVLGGLHHVGDIGQPHRRAILVRDHQLLVLIDRRQLVIRIDGPEAGGAVEVALRGVRVSTRDGDAQRIETQAGGGQRARVGLNAHGVLLAAAKRHQAHARHLADLQGEPGVGNVLHLGQRQRVRGQRQRQYRCIGRVDLCVGRRRRQVGRQ